MKKYITRLNVSPGRWAVDPEPRTLRETKHLAKINRVIGGMTSQIWPEEEARKVFPEVFADEPTLNP